MYNRTEINKNAPTLKGLIDKANSIEPAWAPTSKEEADNYCKKVNARLKKWKQRKKRKMMAKHWINNK